MSTAGEKTPRKRKQTENAISKNVNSSKKKRKTSKPLQDAANDEHAQLLGSVTGQIGRLPLEGEEASSVEENVSESEKQDCGSDEKKSKKETSGVDKWVALNYLSVWDTNRERWSFKKKVQYWLLQNMYNKDEVGFPKNKIKHVPFPLPNIVVKATLQDNAALP